jgi:glucosamine--fructose-6-phosphate aminotransferase (isomerizing)
VEVLDPRFKHYMLQEIHAQPRTAMEAVAQYLSPENKLRSIAGIALPEEQVQKLERVSIIASGTSRHAGMVGEFMLERLARLPVKVDFASQYCYRDPLTEENELAVLLSQSGTTADTLSALLQAKSKNARTIAICNVQDAPLAREADGVLYTHAGIEVSVAATKSFTAQLIALYALGVHLGHTRRALSAQETRGRMNDLMALPEKIEAALTCAPAVAECAQKMKDAQSFLFLGRDISYPIALEGALKLKETSYIHAEGMPTGEMKHGPNAMVDEHLPVVMILTRDVTDPQSTLRWEKSVALLEEVAKRGVHVTAVACQEDVVEVAKHTSKVFAVPTASTLLLPVLEIIPLQLLAYHIAVLKGVNVDSPRNLSKSVTVE